MFKELLQKYGLIKSEKNTDKKTPILTKRNKNKTPVQKNKRAGSEVKYILKKEKVPPFTKIASLDDGEYSLTKKQQNDYIVLAVDEDITKAIVISSTEQMEKSSVDNDLLTIKQKLRSDNVDFKHYVASRSIIGVVYESEKENTNKDKKKNEGFIADFDRIMTVALRENISDVHFEVRRKEARVRFRKNGEMVLFTDWPVKYGRDMSSVVYQVLAQEKEPSFIEAHQQAARIERTIDGIDLNIRLNTLPASGGFDVVMRLLRLDSDSEVDTVTSDLGYSEKQVEDIEMALARPTGVIIIAGTTGSGKSTSLSTMLNGKIRENTGKDGPTIKVITVEDPTEYTIDGATQSGVVRNKNSDANPFAEAIKAAMRCDPDLLMVGEVRDPHSAELLVGAVQSGHTAFTTVHAASGVGIIPRLKGFGVGYDVLGSADFISALIYQTLLRVSCTHCNMTHDEYMNDDRFNKNPKLKAMQKRLENATKGRDVSKIKYRNPEGCDKCTGGVVGRTVVAEVILPSAMMRSAFEQGKVNLALYYHLRNGGELIVDHGIEKILSGISDPFDVEKAIGPLSNKINVDDLAESLGMERTDSNKKVQFKDEAHEEMESKLFNREDSEKNKIEQYIDDEENIINLTGGMPETNNDSGGE